MDIRGFSACEWELRGYATGNWLWTRKTLTPSPTSNGLAREDPSTQETQFCLICSSKARSKLGSCRENLPDSPQPFSKDGKMANWQRRQTHLHSAISKYPRRLRQDALDLAKVFMARKALKLRLCDNYLAKIWQCSRRTVTRRLHALEEKGFLKRLTFPPRRKNGGGWEQIRFIFLLLRKVKHTLARQFGSQSERSEDHFVKHQPQAGKSREPKLDFKAYLSLRSDVPLRSFLYWARKWGANPRSMGYLRRIWKGVSNRADLLESILWDAEEGGFKGQQKVGFIVAEIKARACA